MPVTGFPSVKGRDQRRQPRAVFGRMAHVESSGRLFAAKVEDVSEGGLRLEAPWLGLGAAVAVALPLQQTSGDVKCLLLSGSVVRRLGESVGVALGKMPRRQRRELRRHAARLAELP